MPATLLASLAARRGKTPKDCRRSFSPTLIPITTAASRTSAPTIPPDGDLGDYLRSLRRLLDFDADVLYPAHGPRIHNPRAKIESYLAHRALRDEQILEGLEAGVHTIPELVARIYTDVPEYLHGAAGMSVDAHLRNMVKEGIARRESDRWFLA